jgi:hypothetical protein
MLPILFRRFCFIAPKALHYLAFQSFYLERTWWVHPRFLVGFVYPIFSFICMFCRSLFVLLYFFFWSLYCLFFFDLRILTTPLISLSSSYSRNTSFTLILIFTFLLVNLVIFYNLYFRVWRNGVAIYTSEHNGFLVWIIH